ncbi:MAG: ATP-binding protein [Coriobacteriales bacterium]|jgi:predicted AAA+ superfamily ATPase|nr:ATP-binding protein [Coriobacteriales bacterium]
MKRRLEQQLKSWHDSSSARRPLLINGARQSGKTWLLKEFAQTCYEGYVHVSLDVEKRVASYFDESISPQRIVQLLEAEYRQKIVPGKTLLILDEIQSCERALTSLKYFAEDAPEYHVAAAGSLLGVAINRERYSFPVGKVQTHTLFSLDFEEYLWAMGDTQLADDIKLAFATMKPLVAGQHDKAISRYREYLAVGGMPAAVAAFINSGSVLDSAAVHQEIMDNYTADMAKYASETEAVKIRACYNSLPAQLAKDNHKFQYKVVRNGGTATIFGAALEWLELAGVIFKNQMIEQGTQPLPVHADLSAFRLYMSDTGLLCSKSGVRASDVLSGGLHHFQGALAENYVAQQLAARGYQLFYWSSGNTAEVDYVVQSQSGVSAVEVKSGLNTHSKSLNQFTERYSPYRSIRLSLKPFGDGGKIRAVPLYAAFCI